MELNTLAENISALSAPSVGIAGEARCVITSADGNVRLDTGYQKNLILNQGLDFFGGGKGGAINASCAIGSGNSTPVATQTKLDAFVAIVDGTNTTSDYSYVDDGSGLYKMWEQKQYRFEGLSNVNISELGLVSQGGASNYYLTTRVLLKDALGAPTTITVKAGETLDIYYKVHKVISTTDKSYVINVLDGDGGAVPYNVVVRPQSVGSDTVNRVSRAIYGNSSGYSNASPLDLVAITSEISVSAGGSSSSNSVSIASHIQDTFKTLVQVYYGLNDANINIRTLTPLIDTTPIQIRFGRVSDDAPLTKTDKETLSIPLEFSWGRYEGVL